MYRNAALAAMALSVPPMVWHLNIDGRNIMRAGVLPPNLGAHGIEQGPSMPLFSRAAAPAPPQELHEALGQIQRGEFAGDISSILLQMSAHQQEVQRAITSGMTAFPVRENLEAEAKVLVPLDTPVRNKLPRRVGSGKASAWKQLTSMGGGWAAGDQPGEGPGALRTFFTETGAPAEHTSVYADKSAPYKFLGTYFAVTGFAMASGANFQNQLAAEKTNAIRNLMLNEENALLNSDSTVITAPWGDGATAMGFDGLNKLISTANGVPAAQVQTAVGALTTAHIDAQLARLWKQGAQGVYMIMNEQEARSLVHLVEATGTMHRIMVNPDGRTVLGVSVSGYVHPITGEIVDILVSRFQAAGTILYCAASLPDGSPAIDVEVLPQVQLPELAPNENVQGYTAQELAPTTAAPQVYPGIVTVYETVRLKSANHVAKSTGVTAV